MNAKAKPAILFFNCGLIICLFFFSSCAQERSGRKQPAAKNGVLDLRDWDFGRDGSIALNGEWDFYWKKYLPVAGGGESGLPEKSGIIDVPRSWNNFTVNNREISGEGYATYRLRILLNGREKSLAFKVCDISTAYAMYVNGEKTSSIGVAGKSLETTVPGVLPHVAEFRAEKQEIEIILHVSNFHLGKGGIRKEIQLGLESDIRKTQQRALAFDLFLIGSLFLMGIYHIGLFMIRRKDKSSLYFGLVCFLICIRSLFESERYFIHLFPGVSWEYVTIKIIYLSIYLPALVFFLFIYSLFPKDISKRFLRILQVFYPALSIIVILTPARIHVRLEQTFEVMFLIEIAYIVFVLVLATFRKREGAVIFLFGVVVIFLTTTNDVLYANEIISTGHLTPFGLFILVFSQAFLLSVRFSKAFNNVEILSNDLQSKNRRLLEMDNLKNEFLSNTSHELRTPLNGIIGIANSLIDGATGKLPETTKFNLRMVVQSAARLSNLVNDILDFSKMKHGKLQFDLKPTDVNSVTDIVLALSQALVNQKPIVLTNLIPDDLPLVETDENRLQQILINLIGNAVKFTQEGEIKVFAEIVDAKWAPVAELEETRLVRVSVSDTGIGIPEDKIEKIFESFEQADGSTAREFGGTGLGLTITKKLVEMLGGTIEVESRVGAGSVLSFSLPVAAEQKREQPSTSQTITSLVPLSEGELTQYSDIEANKAKTQAATILVVDDEPVNLQVLRNQLSLYSYNVTAVPDGFQALEEVKKQKPDLIILDLMMPHLNGYEVCEKIREEYSASSLPIIMLTAKNRLPDLVRGFKSGANDYLAKPFSKEELLSRMRIHLKLHEFSDALEKANHKLENLNQTLEGKVLERTSELSAKNNQQKELLHILCHDLSNPFVNIKGALEFSKYDASFFEQIKSMLTVSVENGLELINMIREMRAIDEGKLNVNLAGSNLGQLLIESKSILNQRLLDKKINLEINVSEEQRILVEKVSFINSVLNNILSNAIKFSYSGTKIEVNSFIENGFLILSIRDYGIGMSDTLRNHIFDMNKVTHRPGTDGETGTGFGMPLVKKFMTAYGGDIEIFSKAKTQQSTEHGTTVNLKLKTA